MAKDIPTRSATSYSANEAVDTIYAVGRVSKDGQQDFASGKDVKYKNDWGAAVA